MLVVLLPVGLGNLVDEPILNGIRSPTRLEGCNSKVRSLRAGHHLLRDTKVRVLQRMIMPQNEFLMQTMWVTRLFGRLGAVKGPLVVDGLSTRKGKESLDVLDPTVGVLLDDEGDGLAVAEGSAKTLGDGVLDAGEGSEVTLNLVL